MHYLLVPLICLSLLCLACSSDQLLSGSGSPQGSAQKPQSSTPSLEAASVTTNADPSLGRSLSVAKDRAAGISSTNGEPIGLALRGKNVRTSALTGVVILDDGLSWCSGSLVNGGRFILTARHCNYFWREPNTADFTQYTICDPDGTSCWPWIKGNIFAIYDNPHADLTLLKLNNAETRVPSLDLDFSGVGLGTGPYTSVGYEGYTYHRLEGEIGFAGKYAEITFRYNIETGQRNGYSIVDSSKAACFWTKEELEIIPNTATNAETYPGDSGGPSLNSAGQIVGVNSAYNSTVGFVSSMICTVGYPPTKAWIESVFNGQAQAQNKNSYKISSSTQDGTGTEGGETSGADGTCTSQGCNCGSQKTACDCHEMYTKDAPSLSYDDWFPARMQILGCPVAAGTGDHAPNPPATPDQPPATPPPDNTPAPTPPVDPAPAQNNGMLNVGCYTAEGGLCGFMFADGKCPAGDALGYSAYPGYTDKRCCLTDGKGNKSTKTNASCN